MVYWQLGFEHLQTWPTNSLLEPHFTVHLYCFLGAICILPDGESSPRMRPTKIFLSINRPSVDLRVFQARGSYLKPTHGRKRYSLMSWGMVHTAETGRGLLLLSPAPSWTQIPSLLLPTGLYLLAGVLTSSVLVHLLQGECCPQSRRHIMWPLGASANHWVWEIFFSVVGAWSYLLCPSLLRFWGPLWCSFMVFFLVLSTRKRYRIPGHRGAAESSSSTPSSKRRTCAAG